MQSLESLEQKVREIATSKNIKQKDFEKICFWKVSQVGDEPCSGCYTCNGFEEECTDYKPFREILD